MPKELEEKLKKEAKKKFPKDIERQNAYVYGTLRKNGGGKRASKRSK